MNGDTAFGLTDLNGDKRLRAVMVKLHPSLAAGGGLQARTLGADQQRAVERHAGPLPGAPAMHSAKRLLAQQPPRPMEQQRTAR